MKNILPAQSVMGYIPVNLLLVEEDVLSVKERELSKQIVSVKELLWHVPRSAMEAKWTVLVDYDHNQVSVISADRAETTILETKCKYLKYIAWIVDEHNKEL